MIISKLIIYVVLRYQYLFLEKIWIDFMNIIIILIQKFPKSTLLPFRCIAIALLGFYAKINWTAQTVGGLLLFRKADAKVLFSTQINLSF